METPALTVTQSAEQCGFCQKNISDEDTFCQSCGYPLKGTEQEQADFHLQHEFVNIDLASFNDKVRKAGNVLYYLSAIFAAYGLIFYFIKPNDDGAFAGLITNLILALLFLGLGGYSRKKPMVCLISGLSLYVIVVILNAIVDPVSIVRGIIFKIAIIGFLIKGLKSAIEVERIKKENNIS